MRRFFLAVLAAGSALFLVTGVATTTAVTLAGGGDTTSQVDNLIW